MKCAICDSEITKRRPFTDPRSHKPTCPIYLDGDEVAQVIKNVTEEGIEEEER